jgi:hypothetical protein
LFGFDFFIFEQFLINYQQFIDDIQTLTLLERLNSNRHPQFMKPKQFLILLVFLDLMLNEFQILLNIFKSFLLINCFYLIFLGADIFHLFAYEFKQKWQFLRINKLDIFDTFILYLQNPINQTEKLFKNEILSSLHLLWIRQFVLGI